MRHIIACGAAAIAAIALIAWQHEKRKNCAVVSCETPDGVPSDRPATPPLPQTARADVGGPLNGSITQTVSL